MIFSKGVVHKQCQKLGGGGVKNRPKMLTDSTKKLPTWERGCVKIRKNCKRRLWMVPNGKFLANIWYFDLLEVSWILWLAIRILKHMKYFNISIFSVLFPFHLITQNLTFQSWRSSLKNYISTGKLMNTVHTVILEYFNIKE